MSKFSLLLKAIHTAVNEGADINWAPDYAEPGYSTNSEHGIFFANWNPKDFGENRTGHQFRPVVHTIESRIGYLLDKAGIDIEWSDEWITCDACLNAIRTSPDCYSWRPSYFLFEDGDLLCKDCLLYELEYYESNFMNNKDVADTFDIDWSERGWYRCKPRYETGFHPGQNDSPEAIAEKLEKVGKVDYLFSIDSTGQFNTYWSLWIRSKDYEEE